MSFIRTKINGLLVFNPTIWGDERGYFYESYNESLFSKNGVTNHFIQDNQAKSSYGVLRGLHYQTGDFAQAKLVRVTEGVVLDVAVDLRKNSNTYGEWYSIILSAQNQQQLMVPRGFAHGYVVLSETAIFQYKVDNVYSKAHEGGLLWNDPTLNIDWQIPADQVQLSDKDKILPHFGNHIPA